MLLELGRGRLSPVGLGWKGGDGVADGSGGGVWMSWFLVFLILISFFY